MKWLGIIIFIVEMLLMINLIIKKYFEKKTKYIVELHYMPNWFTISYVFFGFLMLPFHKRIKEYRKQYYMITQIRHREWWKLSRGHDYEDEGDKKYDIFKRYLKIKKLKGGLLVKYK